MNIEPFLNPFHMYICFPLWKLHGFKLIQWCLDSGFIQPSSSAHVWPSNKNALPRWVCDYRQLNANTIPENFLLPWVDGILADCVKGKTWAMIDMTDCFFQTRMHPDNIHKTAVTTPFGAYEWCVMSMGFWTNLSFINSASQMHYMNSLEKSAIYIYKVLWFSLSFSFYFTFRSSFHSIPFGPHSLSIPTSLLHEALLISLIYDSQALRLTSTSIPALPCTALWLVLTPFHLEAAPPLYFPSVWLVMTRPLSFTGLPFAYHLHINTL